MKRKTKTKQVSFRPDEITSQILKHYTKDRHMVRSKAINLLIQKAQAEGGI